MKRRRKGSSSKDKIENWLRSDVRLPCSVCVTFLVLAILSAVFVFGESIVSELAGNNADGFLSPHELFLVVAFLILFILILIGISYIPHGVYSLYKRITRRSRELKRIRRLAIERYVLIYPFVSLGLLLLFTALFMWYYDLYSMGVFDRSALITISVIIIVVIYGTIFSMIVHCIWITSFGKYLKQKTRRKKST